MAKAVTQQASLADVADELLPPAGFAVVLPGAGHPGFPRDRASGPGPGRPRPDLTTPRIAGNSRATRRPFPGLPHNCGSCVRTVSWGGRAAASRISPSAATASSRRARSCSSEAVDVRRQHRSALATYGGQQVPALVGQRDQHRTTVRRVGVPQDPTALLQPLDLGRHRRLAAVIRAGEVTDPCRAELVDLREQPTLCRRDLEVCPPGRPPVDPGDHAQQLSTELRFWVAMTVSLHIEILYFFM